MTKPKKKRQVPFTPKLKKLALLMPAVMEGTMTLKAAMLQAGYAESSSNQQSEAVGAIRKNTVMQEALRKAGEAIAQGVKEADALECGDLGKAVGDGGERFIKGHGTEGYL